jgi:hypothetical protein
MVMIMGAIATYNGYVIGQYIRANPTIDSFSAAGAILFKRCPRFGRELFGGVLICVLLFIMAAHVVGFQVMMIVSGKQNDFISFTHSKRLLAHDRIAL